MSSYNEKEIHDKYVEIWDSITKNYIKQEWKEFDILLTCLMIYPIGELDKKNLQEIYACSFDLSYEKAYELQVDEIEDFIDKKIIKLVRKTSLKFSKNWEAIKFEVFSRIQNLKK